MTDENLQAKEEVADEIIKGCMRDIRKLNFLTLGREHTMLVKHCARIFM